MPTRLQVPKDPFLPDVTRTRCSGQSRPRQPKTMSGWRGRPEVWAPLSCAPNTPVQQRPSQVPYQATWNPPRVL